MKNIWSVNFYLYLDKLNLQKQLPDEKENFELKYKEFLFNKYVSNDNFLNLSLKSKKKSAQIDSEKVKEIIKEFNNNHFSVEKIYQKYIEKYGNVNFSSKTLYRYLKFNMGYRYITKKEKINNIYKKK